MTTPDARPPAFGDSPTGADLAPLAGFVCLPRAVLRAPGLSRDAKLLYAVLADYARQDGHCFPGTERLRADLGCGHNQLARALRELEAAGLITRRRRGPGRTTLYTLPPLPRFASAPGAAGGPSRPSDSSGEISVVRLTLPMHPHLVRHAGQMTSRSLTPRPAR